MSETNETRQGEIKVSSKTLGLISAGIYRSTAGALKELISNAFDADADWVRISMNPPSFDIVSITDNGSGMSFDKFIRLMERQIGDSDKRMGGQRTPIKGRPLIGRIGIGLLAISQICHVFEIVSHHAESETAFRARVHLIDYLAGRMDAADPNQPTYDIGRYEAIPIEYDPALRGTSIIATVLRRGFVRRFRERSPRLLPRSFDTFFHEVVRHNSLRELSEYWRTTWNIALSAPLPYYDGGPVRGIDTDPLVQHQLESFGFRVEVDAMPLQRPVVLPPREKDQPARNNINVVPLVIDRVVDGSRLKGTGYIYSQGGKSIYPAELRGMLIRIKNVAIGTYDKNFLDYPIVEGPRFGWLSGELNVEEGLEDALNIDRDSFNETHPHYIVIQTLIYEALGQVVRPWLYKNLDARKDARERQANIERERRLRETISTIVPTSFQIKRVREPSTRGRNDQFVAPVRVDLERGLIEINETATWPRPMRERDLAEQIAIAFELALASSDREEVRRRFYSLFGQIFR